MSQARQPWTHGSESGRQILVLGYAVVLSVVVLDQLLNGRLTFFFDLCFVTLCLVLAVRVAPEGFYTMCLVPPLLLVTVFWFLAALAPGLVADPRDGVVQALVSGVAHHSGALVAGHALALGTLAHRRRGLLADETPVEAPGETVAQASNRDGSPEPTRSTSG